MSYLYNKNDHISSYVEQDNLSQQLLISPVTSGDFSGEFISYPREKVKKRD